MSVELAGRGPDPIRLRGEKALRLVEEGRELGAQLERWIAEWLEARDALNADGARLDVDFGQALNDAVARRLGVPFWDREP